MWNLHFQVRRACWTWRWVGNAASLKQTQHGKVCVVLQQRGHWWSHREPWELCVSLTQSNGSCHCFSKGKLWRGRRTVGAVWGKQREPVWTGGKKNGSGFELFVVLLLFWLWWHKNGLHGHLQRLATDCPGILHRGFHLLPASLFPNHETQMNVFCSKWAWP